MDHLAIHLMLLIYISEILISVVLLDHIPFCFQPQENGSFCLAATIKLIYFPMAWFLIRAFIRSLTV